MSSKQLKSPQSSESAEGRVPVSYNTFAGMIKGDVPLSKIPPTHVYRHVNAVGYGAWAEGRTGTRRYSSARLPEVAFTANPANDRLTTANRFEDGDRVRVRSRGALPAPLDENTVYYVIYVDATTIELATTYANAIAGTQIDITDAGVGTHFIRYAGVLRAKLDHRKEKKILKMYGRRVYVAERIMEQWIEVLNCEAVDPIDDDSTFAESDTAAVLAAGNIYRIVLNENFYYMYRINLPMPAVLITDIVETVLLTFGYRYVFGFGYITGRGIRNRLSDGFFLRFETGTCKTPDVEKFYSEVFFNTAIGDNLAQDHIISYLTLPLEAQHINFYTLYRTKNIGATTGGVANNKQFFVWDEDVPVAKAISVTVAVNTVTAVAGQEGFVRGDVGCTLRVDAAGTRTGVIATWVAANQVTLTGGHTLGAAEDVAIGEGRVMTAVQAGLLCTRLFGDQFVLADEGRRLYFGDGGEGIIRTYIDANNVEMAEAANHLQQAATIQLNAGSYAFRRKWNDTIRDNGDSVALIGISERMEASRDLYIPNVNFNPVPSSNLVICDSGFSLFAVRDGVDYWYSNIGAKAFIEGQYRADHQFGKIPVSIRDIKVMPALAVFVCPAKTFVLALNVPVPNVGNQTVGEFIQKLTEAAEVDGSIGVIHWKTIAFINAALFMAVTNEPAVRTFDGHQWSPENFAIDQSTGLSAVMDDLNKIDSHYGLVAWYSAPGGYKIFAWKWQET